MQAIIHITGTQTVDGQADTIELSTEGTMVRDGAGWLIRYEETAATGMEGTVTELHAEEGRVTLERQGTHSSVLVLELHKRHHSNYMTPYGAIDLGTYATELLTDLSEDGGELHFSYTLGFNGSISSTHSVNITVKKKS